VPPAARGGRSRPVESRTVELRGLTKRFGPVPAVEDLTVDVRPGLVTGFLGPNGAGKSTTMRMILGLDHPTSGEARIGGLPFARLGHPMRTVGALLDARAVHPGRTAAGHLRGLAASNGLPARRVDEVLGTVGLADVAGRRTRGFSLGMLQRLGVAGALLGDPAVLLFDEPVNGLDPEGVRWMRRLMRELAGQGRTVLVSSHLMAEMALTADHLIVIGRGRLIADQPVGALVEAGGRGGGRVVVALASPVVDDGARDHVSRDDVSRDGVAPVAALAARLLRAGARTAPDASAPDALAVTGLDAASVGRIAAEAGLALARLTTEHPSLEDVFLDLTEGSVEYRSEGSAR